MENDVNMTFLPSVSVNKSVPSMYGHGLTDADIRTACVNQWFGSTDGHV